MDLIAASAKEEDGHHVHGWVNTPIKEKAVVQIEK